MIASNQIHNGPTRDDIPLGGWQGPRVKSMPGAMNYPELYFIEQ